MTHDQIKYPNKRLIPRLKFIIYVLRGIGNANDLEEPAIYHMSGHRHHLKA